MKLKRKLVFKGHYLYDFIKPQKVIGVLSWLKANNPLTHNITICDAWEQHWQTDDADLWEAIIDPSTDDCHVAMAELSLADQSGRVPEPMVNTRQSGDIQTIAIQHGYTVENVPDDGFSRPC